MRGNVGDVLIHHVIVRVIKKRSTTTGDVSFNNYLFKKFRQRRPAQYGNKYWDKQVRKSKKKIKDGRAKKYQFYAENGCRR